MAESFTMFEKFGDVCEALEEPDRKELIYAISMYGMFGEEVELPYLLKALFISLKEDIDNSKNARARGSKGGRPKGKPEVGEVSETRKPEVFETAKPEVSEHAEPEVSASGAKTESQTKPDQASAGQTSACQTSPEGEGAHARRGGAGAEGAMDPPTLGEVREHFAANCLRGDPDAFWGHWDSAGWKRRGEPIENWRSLAVKWASDQRAFDAHRSVQEEIDRRRLERAKPPEEREAVSPLPRAVNAVDWEAELAALGGAA